MGWEDNDFDWMDDSGYSSDGGMDFGDTSDYTNNLDVTTDDYSGAWSGFGNNDYSSGDWDYGYQDTGGGWGGNIGGGDVDLSNPSYNYNGAGLTQAPQTAGSSIMPYLQNLFNNPNAVGMAGKGIAALFEGYQNKKKAEAMKQLAKNPALDPFGSQRPFYQQQAQQAVTNPYDSPIVKAQIEQLQNAQNIKDAQAGRRSNMLTSSPAVMAEMAKIAQNYQQQMAVQGGANIAPSGGLAEILSKGTTYDTNGYISPLLTAAGYGVQNNALANLTAEQKKLLGQQWANA